MIAILWRLNRIMQATKPPGIPRRHFLQTLLAGATTMVGGDRPALQPPEVLPEETPAWKKLEWKKKLAAAELAELLPHVATLKLDEPLTILFSGNGIGANGILALQQGQEIIELPYTQRLLDHLVRERHNPETAPTDRFYHRTLADELVKDAMKQEKAKAMLGPYAGFVSGWIGHIIEETLCANDTVAARAALGNFTGSAKREISLPLLPQLPFLSSFVAEKTMHIQIETFPDGVTPDLGPRRSSLALGR